MDTRLSSSFHHLIICQHNYYLHIADCPLCLQVKSHQDNICGDFYYFLGEVKAAENVYFQMCEEIMVVKTGAQK